MMNIMSLLALSGFGLSIIVALITAIIAIPASIFVTLFLQKRKNKNNKVVAANIIQEAEAEAKNLKKEAILEAKDEVYKLKTECDTELKERRAEIQKSENRIMQREDFINMKEEFILIL